MIPLILWYLFWWVFWWQRLRWERCRYGLRIRWLEVHLFPIWLALLIAFRLLGSVLGGFRR